MALEVQPGRGELVCLAMSRINDVGGMAGFPAVVEEPDEPPFHADWEAHVFALNGALIKRGVYNLDEFRDAQERLPAAALPDRLVLRALVRGDHHAAGGEGRRHGRGARGAA